jgi:hypothetical protein
MAAKRAVRHILTVTDILSEAYHLREAYFCGRHTSAGGILLREAYF